MTVPMLVQRLIVASVTSSVLWSGCVAHESVGRPPAPAQIERINEYEREHGGLEVEYVTPLPACAAGSCGGEQALYGLPDDIAALVSSNEHDTVVLTEDGQKRKLRAEIVAGVSARDRARGAAVGAGVGAAVSLGLTLTLGMLIQGGNGFPDAPAPSTSGGDDWFKVAFWGTVSGGLGGALWGYVVGGRRSFDFAEPALHPQEGGEARSRGRAGDPTLEP